MPRHGGKTHLTFVQKLIQALPRRDLNRLAEDTGVISGADDLVRPYVENRVVGAIGPKPIIRHWLATYVLGELGLSSSVEAEDD